MWKPLIICNTKPDLSDACTFGSLVALAQNLIYDLIVLSTFIAVIGFAYAGFLLLTSGGSTGQKDKAKAIFLKIGKGYLWILVAWLLVYTIMSLLRGGFSILGAPQ